MSIEEPGAPELLRFTISNLWRASHRCEEQALDSQEFKRLEDNCRTVYAPIDGSRLPQSASDSSSPNSLQTALRNFLQWNSAPWHKGECPNADETAQRLHGAFLSSQINRTFFVPLDRLLLLDKSLRPCQRIKNVRFGSNEVALLTHAELSQRIPQDGLKRFGDRYKFPIDNLDDRYWIIVKVRENAGAIWERHLFRFMYEPTGEYGKIPMFEPTYPMEVEKALFVLLLSFLRDSDNITQDPFLVPWIYSFTDDPFSKPNIAPDPSALSWSIVGDPGQEFQVPDQSNTIELTEGKRESLHQRWRKLQTILANKESASTNFHPLTLHFFIKAFADEGIDEIISTISCIEATLQLPNDRNPKKKKLMKRYKVLVKDNDCNRWLDRAYRLRNNYLHSVEDPGTKITLRDLGKTRLSLVNAVDAYINLASRRFDCNRESLLRSLSMKNPVEY